MGQFDIYKINKSKEINLLSHFCKMTFVSVLAPAFCSKPNMVIENTNKYLGIVADTNI